MFLKNPVTPPGIDPGTVRLVAQRFNHCATPGPSYLGIFRKYVQKIRVSLKSGKNKGTLHEDQCTYMIISLSSS